MAKKKVLGIFAHGDDEVLFGWPYLQNPAYDRYVLICSKEKPPEAAAGRVTYYSPRGSLVTADAIQNACRKVEPDFIVTHNPWGEYGHPDHIALHNMLATKFPGRVRWADIVAKNIVWRLPDLDMTAPPMQNIKLDADWFNYGKAIYEAAGAWTTNQFLMNPSPEQTKEGVTIRCNIPMPAESKKVLWVVETLGWAWWKRAQAMIKRMPEYSHRVMWAVTGKQVAETCGDADVVIVCHPTLLPYVPKDKKAILIGASARSFEQCLS